MPDTSGNNVESFWRKMSRKSKKQTRALRSSIAKKAASTRKANRARAAEARAAAERAAAERAAASRSAATRPTIGSRLRSFVSRFTSR